MKAEFTELVRRAVSVEMMRYRGWPRDEDQLIEVRIDVVAVHWASHRDLLTEASCEYLFQIGTKGQEVEVPHPVAAGEITVADLITQVEGEFEFIVGEWVGDFRLGYLAEGAGLTLQGIDDRCAQGSAWPGNERPVREGRRRRDGLFEVRLQ